MNRNVVALIHTSCFALGAFALEACSSHEPASKTADDTSRPPLPSSSSADLSATLDGIVASGVAPGVSLTVAHASYETWSGASGVGSIETGKALAPTDRFRAGSMLKMGVATAVLQLIEQSELSLDDDLTKLVPSDVAAKIPDARAITLRMLLGHTSGLADFDTADFHALVASNPTRIWTFDELLDRALAQPPVFPPGTGWSYTNTGYILLGRILEETTGDPWRTSLRKQVFARAKLEHSELPEEGNARCDGCSRGYVQVGDALVDITEVDPSMASAAGGDALVTTTEDLVKFLGALSAGKLFDDPKTLELMTDFKDAPVPQEAQTGYGLGLTRFQVGDVELFGHLGSTAGFQGFAFVHPDSGTVASGYMNRTGDLGAFILPVLDAVERVE